MVGSLAECSRYFTELDLGRRLVAEKHSRSTYHNSVRHSRDHSERLLRGTARRRPIDKPRCMRRTAFSRCAVIKPSLRRSGPAAVEIGPFSRRFQGCFADAKLVVLSRWPLLPIRDLCRSQRERSVGPPPCAAWPDIRFRLEAQSFP